MPEAGPGRYDKLFTDKPKATRRLAIKGVVIAAPQSGSGKTTVSLALMAAFRRRGLTVAPFKVGPDFIDPGHHRSVTGCQSRNLDGWILSEDYNRRSFHQGCQDADIAVVEGVMGLYDGYDGRTEAGSTAQMAKWLGLDVLLVADARRMARSAAALVQGFERFDPELSFVGVLFNYLGSAHHLSYLQQALADHVQMPCLGGILRDEAVAIPERHLGLVTAEEHLLSPEATDNLARWIENAMDLEGLINRLPDIAVAPISPAHPAIAPNVRIGVARDAAFCFYYPDNFDILGSFGAKMVPFSPIADTALPPDISGLYLGGGYPELFAEALAANTAMRQAIFDCCQNQMPIYGECGGFMYLCQAIGDLSGKTHAMSGCFPYTAQMLPKLKALGYREIELKQNCLLGAPGTRIRGHEFHYSQLEPIPAENTAYSVFQRKGEKTGQEGYRVHQALGSYLHLHWGSCPQAAESFVNACMRYQKEHLR